MVWMDGDEVWMFFYVCLVFYPFLCLPFYSSKGRPRLHVVGDRVGVDRGVVR